MLASRWRAVTRRKERKIRWGGVGERKEGVGEACSRARQREAVDLHLRAGSRLPLAGFNWSTRRSLEGWIIPLGWFARQARYAEIPADPRPHFGSPRSWPTRATWDSDRFWTRSRNVRGASRTVTYNGETDAAPAVKPSAREDEDRTRSLAPRARTTLPPEADDDFPIRSGFDPDDDSTATFAAATARPETMDDRTTPGRIR